MADASVKIRLTAEDAASPKINSLRQSLSDLASTGGLAGSVLGGAVAGGVAGLTMAAVQAVPAITNATWAMAEASAQSMRTEASFHRLAEAAGTTGAAMLRAMKEASRGTIDDTSLMIAANRAMVLGVADSAEEMAALVEAAIIRGRDMGLSAKQAVNDLVTGIGRMSPQILDNLGIVGAQQSIEEYAKSLGKVSQQLTDVEKKQALLNAVLASTQGIQIVDDAASSFERMNTAIANAQDALGKLFSPAIAAIAQTLADTVNSVLNPEQATSNTAGLLGVYFNMIGRGISDIAANVGELGTQFNLTFNQTAVSSERLSAEIATLQERLAAMKAVQADQVLHGQAQAAQASQVAIDQLNERIATLQRSLYAQNAAIHDSIYGVQMLAGATRTAAGDVNTLAGAVLNLDAALNNMAPVLGNLQGIRQGAIGRAEALAMQAVQLGADPQQVAAMLGETTDAIWNMGLAFDATTEAQFLNKVAAEGQLAGLKGLVDGLTEAQRAAVKFASAGISEANKALNDLRSNVSSLVSSQLQSAFSLDDISWPGKDGAGGARVNENARRLAAIANEGLIGQEWLGQFAAEAPATYADLMLKIAEGMDAQGAAQMLLQQFQQGLRPDLINFDMIKQRVKDQLTSQQAIKEMTENLTQQLMAEMGVSAQQVQGALASLGFGGGAVAGGDAGQGERAGATFSSAFVSGFATADVSLKIVMGIGDGIKKNEGLIAAAGKSVGAVFGDNLVEAFSGSTPTRLIDVLTTLVTPQVWAQIQSLQSRTEPT